MKANPNGNRTLLEQLRTVIEIGEGEIIVDGRLLPERELVTRFKVGRHIIRDALKHLEQDGLLYRRQGHGTFINVVGPKTTNVATLTSRTSPQEIIEARQEIEPILARLAAMRSTPIDIDQMKDLVDRGRKATSASQYERWDSAFHAKIAESVRNALFFGVFELINSVRTEQKWIRAREQTFSQQMVTILLDQHTDIIAAIEAREPQAAETAMRRHLRTASDRLTESRLGSP